MVTPVAECLPKVARHHRLDVDHRTEVMGNAGGVAIVNRALAVPRGEHRLNGHPQLLGGIGRELRRNVAEAGDDRAEVVDGEVGIAGDAPRDASACDTFSNSSSRSPRTTVPNIWISRRYRSKTKCASPVRATRPLAVSSLRPMFKTVSIIPGMENFAPDRQDTSSGLVGSPNRLSRTCSTSRSAPSTCSTLPPAWCCRRPGSAGRPGS